MNTEKRSNADEIISTFNLYEKKMYHIAYPIFKVYTIVKKESKKLKLVYVTAECKNTGKTSLREVIYFASMLNLK